MMKLNTYTDPGSMNLAVTATVAFIQEAHQGQKYGDMPYFMHPVEVAQEVNYLIRNSGLGTLLPASNQTDLTLVALLHDVVEDTNYTRNDIGQRYTEEVVEMVMLLTLKTSDDYLVNIQRIIDSENTGAMLVKLADNRVNRRGDKSKMPGNKAERLNRRYDKSIRMLIKALAKHGIEVGE